MSIQTFRLRMPYDLPPLINFAALLRSLRAGTRCTTGIMGQDGDCRGTRDSSRTLAQSESDPIPGEQAKGERGARDDRSISDGDREEYSGDGGAGGGPGQPVKPDSAAPRSFCSPRYRSAILMLDRVFRQAVKRLEDLADE